MGGQRPERRGRKRAASVNLCVGVRRLVETLAARWTLRDGRRWTLQATVEECVRQAGRREGVP